MTDENIISIKGGRYVFLITLIIITRVLTLHSHMLHEATVSSFVPNDTFIVGGRGAAENTPDAISTNPELDPTGETTLGPSMLLLTGPNFSGKSVYLSQVKHSPLMR